jgi:hypothetical protein
MDGLEKIIENNLFVDCPSAFHLDARVLDWLGPNADRIINEAREIFEVTPGC